MAVSLPPRQNYDIINREQNGLATFEYDILPKNEMLKRSLVTAGNLLHEQSGMICRDKSESDNEPDGEPAAKMRRGGGRRKQSKPMRMFADLDGTTDSDLSKPVLEFLPSDSSTLDDVNRRSPSVSGLSDVMPMSCELCHEKLQSNAALRDHFKSVHEMFDHHEMITNKKDVCPTKYHMLGNELKQEKSFDSDNSNADSKEMVAVAIKPQRIDSAEEEDAVNVRVSWQPGKAKEEEEVRESFRLNDRGHHMADKIQSDPFHGDVYQCEHSERLQPNAAVGGLGSLVDRPYGGVGSSKQVSDFGASIPAYDSATQNDSTLPSTWDPTKSRIFHADAYCEICDREFCNKYFLKTHKANKHGIYDNNLTGLDPPSSATNDLFSVMGMLQQQQTPGGTPPKSSPLKLSTDFGSISSQSSSLHLPSVAGLSESAENTLSTSAMKLTSSDSDDYCEICQKHFYSKQHLKKHKQEIHGLLMSDGGSGKRLNAAATVIGGMTISSPNSASIDLSPSSRPLMLPSHMTSSSTSSVPSSVADFRGMANLNNLMFLNPFNSPLAVIPPLFPTHNLGFRPNALTLPQLPGMQDVQNAIGSASRYPANNSALPNNLIQSMGVLNAEALMELYRKEICNAYLMRAQEAATGHASLFPSSLTGAGFQPGLPTSLTGSLTCFGLPGKSGVQDTALSAKTELLFLKKEKHEMSLESCEVCDICKKTFVSKQSLLSHLVTAHNVKQSEPCDLASELMKLDKLNEDHHFENAVFGNMVAAKLVDRVQCEICNKEVCNKYFLKTHKIKVHGWDPVSGDRELQDKSPVNQLSPTMQIQNSISDPSMSDMMNIEKPKEEELLQMGIDPEAYCEICKKEFCNKYFLKTHKQNIHGIKMTNNPPENRPTNTVDNWNFLPILSQSNNLTAAQLSLLAGNQLQTMAPTLNPPPPLMSVLDSSIHMDVSEKQRSSWKWKEPVNAMRVMCEICNKVLCNKYFLKTHMMKRHGINYDTITGQLTSVVKYQGASSDYELQPKEDTRSCDGQPFSQQNSEKQDTTSDASSGIPEQNVWNFVIKDEKNIMCDGKTRGESKQEEEGERIGSTFGSIIDGRPVGGAAAVNLAISSDTSKALDLTSSTTVMAKTWRVPSSEDDFDESNSFQFHDNSENDFFCNDANRKALDGRETSSKVIKNEECDTMAGERGLDGAAVKVDDHSITSMEPQQQNNTADDHTLTIHDTDEMSPLHSSSYEEGKNQNTGVSSLGKFEGTSVDATKTAIAKHIRSQQKKRVFRCTHCRQRFQSRLHCEAHIHNIHPRVVSSVTRGSDSDNCMKRKSPPNYVNGHANADERRYSADIFDKKDDVTNANAKQPPVIYAQPIDQTNLSNILMQPFLMKEVGGEDHFATSLVYLPALQRIHEPVSLTFSLTPILQH